MCFVILTSKCAARLNGVHFFDIFTSKSGPNLVCFVHFDFDRCFVPQGRALFRHLNFQRWSEPGWCLYILTSKCASRHNSVQFFISHLRTRRFSEPTLRPSRATNHWKNTVFRDFPTFSRICIFFLLTLSLLSSSVFCSSLFSASSHLCFSSVHIVGSLTSTSFDTCIKKCVYKYVYKDMCINMSIYVYIYVHIYIYICVCVHINIYMYIEKMYIYIYTYMYVCKYIYVCKYKYMCK